MQTTDQVTATWLAARSALVGTIGPRSYGRKVQLIDVRGPARSTLTIYRGHVPEPTGRLGSVYPADVRMYDAAGSAPIDIRPGEAATFQWTGGDTSSSGSASANVISEVYA